MKCLLQLEEFRFKVGNMFPRIPKNENPDTRTEFANLTDLLQYIIDVDNKAKELKTNSSIENSQSIKSSSDSSE